MDRRRNCSGLGGRGGLRGRCGRCGRCGPDTEASSGHLGHLVSLLMLERPRTGRAETAARQAGRERSWQRSWCTISCGCQRDRVRQASGLLPLHLVDDQLQIHGLVSQSRWHAATAEVAHDKLFRDSTTVSGFNATTVKYCRVAERPLACRGLFRRDYFRTRSFSTRLVFSTRLPRCGRRGPISATTTCDNSRPTSNVATRRAPGERVSQGWSQVSEAAPCAAVLWHVWLLLRDPRRHVK